MMEVFTMDQDQLNSNVMLPGDSSSSSSMPSTRDVCQNCNGVRSLNNNSNNTLPSRVISSYSTDTQSCSSCRVPADMASSSDNDIVNPTISEDMTTRRDNSLPVKIPKVMSLSVSSATADPPNGQCNSLESPSCPHLLNSLEGCELPVGNLNSQTHSCQACGAPSSSLPTSSGVFPSSSSSPSSGPIPIPSRPSYRRPHRHHHHISSSLSSSHDCTQGNPHSSSPPESPFFSYSPSSAMSGWNFRERSGASSGYSTSEPGHFSFFQSPKYFKQPSSSQDYAGKETGSEKPSVFDQWPRSPSRRTPLSSTRKLLGLAAFPSKSSLKISTRSEPSEHPKIKPGLLSSRIKDGTFGWRSAEAGQIYGNDRMEEDDSPELGQRRLPHQLLNQLHELQHHNEDLSADVVFSLDAHGYNIHEILGKGISSTVRRVTEKSTGKEFAVKIIDISGEKGEGAVVEQTKRDTFREIRILRMCGGHPNIIELHDVFETPTFIFLVFEICKQGELFDYLTSVVSLSEKKTRIFMRQLIEAVSYCHESKIVHRDLKPENILLDDDLNIKVSDFGFATVVDEHEELSELCGTPGYLAPEVLAHSMYENVPGYGKEVDMWACGVIMYTLLCGAPPFWNRRQMMMLRAIMNAEYTFNTPEWDDISDAPKNLIEKLLIVNPKHRLTAREALKHPFFHSQVQDQKKFNARRKFRAGVFCVLFYNRLNYNHKNPPPIAMTTISTNPYSIKIMRKIIDTCAFGMYRHWVKRVDNQNRAALFEHTLREDWKHGLIANNGSWNNTQEH